MLTAHLDGALDCPSLDLVTETLHVAVLVVLVDLFLDSADRLVGQSLVFEHCAVVSGIIQTREMGNLRKVNSSSVRLYVSGYMK